MISVYISVDCANVGFPWRKHVWEHVASHGEFVPELRMSRVAVPVAMHEDEEAVSVV